MNTSKSEQTGETAFILHSLSRGRSATSLSGSQQTGQSHISLTNVKEICSCFVCLKEKKILTNISDYWIFKSLNISISIRLKNPVSSVSRRYYISTN